MRERSGIWDVKPRNKRIAEKHYGLFHGPLRIEVEDVTARHKKPCDGCAEPPEDRRLKVTAGSGRSASIAVYCRECGDYWLRDHQEELDRTIQRLDGVHLCIRLIEATDGD